MHVWREKKELESIAGLSCTDRSSHTQPEEREAGSKLPSLKDEQREETLEASSLLFKALMCGERKPCREQSNLLPSLSCIDEAPMHGQRSKLPSLKEGGSHAWAEEKRVSAHAGSLHPCIRDREGGCFAPWFSFPTHESLKSREFGQALFFLFMYWSLYL